MKFARSLRGRRHLTYNAKDDFAIETSDSFLSLWERHPARHFFAVTIAIASIFSGGWRHRDHEHYAGQCYGANQGDRSAQSAGRSARRHPAAILN